MFHHFTSATLNSSLLERFEAIYSIYVYTAKKYRCCTRTQCAQGLFNPCLTLVRDTCSDTCGQTLLAWHSSTLVWRCCKNTLVRHSSESLLSGSLEMTLWRVIFGILLFWDFGKTVFVQHSWGDTVVRQSWYICHSWYETLGVKVFGWLCRNPMYLRNFRKTLWVGA